MAAAIWPWLLAATIAALVVVSVPRNKLWRILAFVGFVCAIPFVFVWLLIDHRTLRATAESLEPPEDVTYQPKNRLDAMLQVFLLYVVRPVVIFFALPCIVLWGLLVMLITRNKGHDDTDDIIW